MHVEIFIFSKAAELLSPVVRPLPLHVEASSTASDVKSSSCCYNDISDAEEGGWVVFLCETKLCTSCGNASVIAAEHP